MMRALKAAALVMFVIAAVCAVVMIAAWPLGATPATSVETPAGQGVPPSARPVPAVPDEPTEVQLPAAAPDSAAHSAPPAASRQQGLTPQLTTRAATPAAPQQDPSSPASGLDTATGPAGPGGIRQSVIMLDRASGAVLDEAEPDLPLPSMSLVKLFIAVDLLDRSGGPDALDPATSDTLWRMITISDDHAASQLWIAGGDGAIVTRVAARFHLTGVRPPANPGMWGDTTITARDVAQFLRQALADPLAGPWLSRAMQSAADTGADGFDQNFGMNTIAGAGSKQGWGCCLRGVRSLDSAGFTADRIVVALAAAPPATADADLRAALTATVRAALDR